MGWDLADLNPEFVANNRRNLEHERLVPRFETASDPASKQASAAASLLPSRHYRGKLGPEDAVQRDIVRMFDEGTAEGRWDVLCCMCANEVRVPGGMGRAAQALGARLLAMGLLPGLPDLLLIWPQGFGFAEVKQPGGHMRLGVRKGDLLPVKTKPGPIGSKQQQFRDVVTTWGHRWACWHSTVEALETARKWGAV
jgi:hypothetical protein